MVYTAGILQIGWATKHCLFESEVCQARVRKQHSRSLGLTTSVWLSFAFCSAQEGGGVGDDANSLAFDGCRRRVWHRGTSVEYGTRAWKPGTPGWCAGNDSLLLRAYTDRLASTATHPTDAHAGDVVGVYLDMDHNTLSYALNGEDFGNVMSLLDPPVNFNNIVASDSGFYPAVSMIVHQHCAINFGDRPFRYASQPYRAPVQHATVANALLGKTLLTFRYSYQPHPGYKTLNTIGVLSPEERFIVPRLALRNQLVMSNNDDPTPKCQICCDRPQGCMLIPCRHKVRRCAHGRVNLVARRTLMPALVHRSSHLPTTTTITTGLLRRLRHSGGAMPDLPDQH